MKKTLFALLVLLLASFGARAQRVAVGTNLGEWAVLGTINGNFSIAAARHLTIGASVKYNPWTFQKTTEDQFETRQRGASLDMRYWPWHIYSGWWIQAKAQVSEYNVGGIFKKHTAEEGTAYGLGLGFGYTLMLSTHFNVDFGVSGWGGMKKCIEYECPYCGSPLWDYRDGPLKKSFLSPDALYINLVYVF